MDSEYSTAPDIDVKPSGELCFKGLSSSIITAQMEVKNPHASPVYFHVKTTAPKRYCVAPNQGLILPNETCYVSVMLQPFEFDPENIVKAKIRVVAMFVPQGRKSDKEFLLTLQDKVAPELKMQTTLMCVYKPPDPGDISVQPVKCRVIGKRWDMNSILQVGVDPGQQLWFEGPFDKVVTVQMKLINPSSRKVYFKVKTTAPRCYCVKPNSGIIWPRATMFVSLVLQPFDYDPGRQVPRHKMMVVAMFVPVDGEEPDKDFLSSLLKNIPPEEKMDMRLVCVHKLPGHHLSDSVPSRSEDAETRHKEFSDITDITDSEFIGEVTESDCVGEITKKVDNVRIGP